MMHQTPAPATFVAFAALGYSRLVPIVPPDAEVYAGSTLARRLNTPADPRGKAVGVRAADGLWRGFDWLPHEADTQDFERWQAMGAGIDIKTGAGLVAIDADTLSEDHAATIRDLVEQHLGRLPIRVGRYPKALYLCRVSGELRYTRIEFGERNERCLLTDRVEVLSDGRQFVAHGIHPTTRQPYTWPRQLIPFDALPVVEPAAVLALLEALRPLLPAASSLIKEGATTIVDQAAFRGEPDMVRRAVGAIPNTSALFPSRESYRDLGYAIKAALPDDEPAAFDIFADWAARWTDGENDPGVVEADWRRMRPPFRRGAGWLYELAEQHSGGQFDRAEVWFEKIPETDNPFETISFQSPFEEAEVVAIDWIDPATWHGVAPRARPWIIDGVVPDGEVTLLTGAGGVGKTLLAQQIGTCAAAGLPALGRTTRQCKVMMFLCEDSADELHARQVDINASLALDMVDVSANLRIASRKYMDNLLVLWDRHTGAMRRQAVWERLRADAVAWGAKLVVVDTIADTFGGSEIDRSQVRQFVQSCLGRLAQEIGGAVLALGHPSKAGQQSGDGTSGSTAWHASVRSRLYLEHVSKDGSGPFRRLTNKKSNYGPAGDTWLLRWSRGALEVVTAKVSASAAAGAGEGVAVPSMADVIDDAILVAVADLAGRGKALSDGRNSPYWAPKILRAMHHATLGMYGVDDVEAGWQRAVAAGRVREATVGYKANRHPIQGFVVAVGVDTLSAGGVFD